MRKKAYLFRSRFNELKRRDLRNKDDGKRQIIDTPIKTSLMVLIFLHVYNEKLVIVHLSLMRQRQLTTCVKTTQFITIYLKVRQSRQIYGNTLQPYMQ